MAIESQNNFKVIHITTAKTGGAGRAALRIHYALEKEGVSTQFFPIVDNFKRLNTTIGNKNPLMQKILWRLRHHFNIELDFRRKIEKEYADILPLNCEFSSIPTAAYSLNKYIQSTKVNIIHLHWVAEFFDLMDFFQGNKLPVVWTLHDINPFSGLFHYENDRLRNISTANRLDCIVREFKRRSIQKFKQKLIVATPSTWLSEEANKSGVFKGHKVCVIPNPINTNLFYNYNKIEIRKKYGFSSNERILIGLADSTQNIWKGLYLLTEVIKEIPGALLLLIGGKDSNVKDEDNIRYLGRINDDNMLSEYYSLADATVIPSREDNLPNVMLESFACGTPVISFNVGGLAEHVKNFETGLIAEEMNAESLRNTIQLFFENQERFDAAKIRKYAEDHFNEKLIAEKYMEVYSRLLDPGNF